MKQAGRPAEDGPLAAFRPGLHRGSDGGGGAAAHCLTMTLPLAWRAARISISATCTRAGADTA